MFYIFLKNFAPKNFLYWTETWFHLLPKLFVPFEKISYIFFKNIAAIWINFQPQTWKNLFYFTEKVFLAFRDDDDD